MVKSKSLLSPLGTKIYFNVNSSRKSSIVLTHNMVALSRVCKPRIEKQFTTSETLGRMGTKYGCRDFCACPPKRSLKLLHRKRVPIPLNVVVGEKTIEMWWLWWRENEKIEKERNNWIVEDRERGRGKEIVFSAKRAGSPLCSLISKICAQKSVNRNWNNLQ